MKKISIFLLAAFAIVACSNSRHYTTQTVNPKTQIDSLNYFAGYMTGLQIKMMFLSNDSTAETVDAFVGALEDSYNGIEVEAEAYDIEENRYNFLPWEVVETYYARHALNFYLAFCNSLPFGEEALSSTEPLILDIISKADEAIAGAPVAADLRFGHDVAFLLLCSYLGLENYGYPRLSAEEAYRNWNGVKLCPFATNLQMVFYKNRKGAVLVKFLANEEETLIPEITAYSGPYYLWDDVKAYLTK